ncbi:MAG TPA: response regulator, partial [Chthonomonadaceae bacterium]|nr:response regulator [Chthonomonadaceae bacterium]
MIRTLIVDDEPLARARLRRMLDSPDLEIVGEADNSAAALALAEHLRPDLLFLDIQMPGMSGLQMAAALEQLDHAPLLVFVTGYSEHALTAFEHNALDYLLKPITAERLAVTQRRVRDRLTRGGAPPARGSRPAISGEPPLRSLPVRADYAVRFIPVREILCAVARD